MIYHQFLSPGDGIVINRERIIIQRILPDLIILKNYHIAGTNGARMLGYCRDNFMVWGMIQNGDNILTKLHGEPFFEVYL